MTAILVDKVTKRFGSTVAVDQVSLQVKPGQLFFLLGPSGCGKTTILRILAGFLEPDQGRVFFDDQPMNGVAPRHRNAGMVFQNYALWPHRTVARNIAYGLEVRRMSRQEIARRVTQALKLVRLEGLADRRPSQLSGGQQQRVALARALVIEPRVLLLDEPLSNLDAQLRLEMREEIRRIHDETALTMVYVTHDQKEAMSLADQVALLRNGKVVQVGTPAELYSRPRCRFVATFLGDTNIIEGTVRATEPDGMARVDTALGKFRGCATVPTQAGQQVYCSIRPEAVNLSQSSVTEGRENCFPGEVVSSSFLGETVLVSVRVGGGLLRVLSLCRDSNQWPPGSRVTVEIPAKQVMILVE